VGGACRLCGEETVFLGRFSRLCHGCKADRELRSIEARFYRVEALKAAAIGPATYKLQRAEGGLSGG
jgi:hypothetical protein